MLSLVSGGSDQIINTMHNTPFADMNDSEREVQAEGHRVFKKMRRGLPLLSDFRDPKVCIFRGQIGVAIPHYTVHFH